MNENKNILVFCDGFNAPSYNPRVRYFCDFFLKKDWEISIVAEKFEDEKLIPKKAKILTLPYYKHKTGFLSKIEWFFKFVINLCFDHKGTFFYKKTINFIENKKIDLVLCSAFYSFPLTTASKTADYLNVPLIVDMRDMPEQVPNNNHLIQHKIPPIFGKSISKLYQKRHLSRRNKVLKSAVHITTISAWHANLLKKYNDNISLIFNGFDENIFIPDVQKTEHFVISFFGRFYDEKLRNPSIFFSALKNLEKKQEINTKNIVVQWFVDEKTKKIVSQYAEKLDVLKFMQFKNLISPEKVPLAMNKSSILLLVENDENQKAYGIFGTKIFEYIGVNRPVLCTPDNKGNLAEILKEIDCGLVSSDATEIENFVLEKYAEWQKNGFTKGTVSEENRKNFSRKNGAEILEKILLEQRTKTASLKEQRQVCVNFNRKSKI